jgi:hypothetical protein
VLLNHPKRKETHQAAPVRMENLDGTKVSFLIIVEVRKINKNYTKGDDITKKKKHFKLQITKINNLPSDISEAKSVTSERIFAISTAAVTQELATYKRISINTESPSQNFRKFY